jgi:predicted glycoside hydrolase/deacetylase ChbG (UPF0249 family)
MIQLILNADDFGLTQSVNDAVFELAEKKALSSTTVMVNMPHAEAARDLLEIDGFGVGLHFNLTEGRPIAKLSEVSTLVDGDGRFHDFKGLIDGLKSGRVQEAQIDAELQAQWDRLSEILGQAAGHLDSHQNIHKQPGVLRALLSFAREHPGLGVRNPHRFVFDSEAEAARPVSSWKHSLRQAKLKRVLTDIYLRRTGRLLGEVFRVPDAELHAANFKKLELLQAIQRGGFPFEGGDGIFEVACHPAVSTEGLDADKLQDKRVQEYECMRDPQFVAHLGSVRSWWDALKRGHVASKLSFGED